MEGETGNRSVGNEERAHRRVEGVTSAIDPSTTPIMTANSPPMKSKIEDAQMAIGEKILDEVACHKISRYKCEI